MSDPVYIDAFITQLRGLLEFLEKRFPEDRDISYTRDQFETGASLSPRLVVKHVMSEINPYITELEAENHDFFLHLVKSDYDHVLGHMDIAAKWSSLTEPERTYLWNTTQRLAKLGSRV